MTTFKSALYAAAFLAPIALAASPALAHEAHGHCSGPSVCQGDAACEKQGYKELTKEECGKISGAKFEASDHKGENHKDDGHDHKK